MLEVRYVFEHTLRGERGDCSSVLQDRTAGWKISRSTVAASSCWAWCRTSRRVCSG
jgi:hypothetical protein